MSAVEPLIRPNLAAISAETTLKMAMPFVEHMGRTERQGLIEYPEFQQAVRLIHQGAERYKKDRRMS